MPKSRCRRRVVDQKNQRDFGRYAHQDQAIKKKPSGKCRTSLAAAEKYVHHLHRDDGGEVGGGRLEINRIVGRLAFRRSFIPRYAARRNAAIAAAVPADRATGKAREHGPAQETFLGRVRRASTTSWSWQFGAKGKRREHVVPRSIASI